MVMPRLPERWSWLVAIPLGILACGQVSEIGTGSGGAASSGGAGSGGAGSIGRGGLGGDAGTSQGASSQGASSQGANGGDGGTGYYGYGGTGVPGYGGVGGTTGGAWGNPSPNEVLGDGWVVSRLRLGDTDTAGNLSNTAWKSIGVDLDGLSSTKDSPDHCQPQGQANPGSVKTDGDGGIDNSFGANILPILLGLDSGLSNNQQAYIDSGRSLVVVTGPVSQDVPALLGSLTGARYGYDGTFDVVAPWFAYDDSYVGGIPRCSLTGSVTAGKLDVTGTGFWELRLQLPMTELVLEVRHTRVVANVSAGSEPTLDGGMLAGLVKTDDFIEAMRQAIGRLDPNLCDGSTFDSIASQIRSASDIRADSTNGDPGQPCDAISIGLGVTLRAVEARKGASNPKDIPGCF